MDPQEGEQAVAYALDPPSQGPDMSVEQCEPERSTQSIFYVVSKQCQALTKKSYCCLYVR